ncbi:MAG: rhomboid family intramembrane serine protease [Planctomycetaceae bacterium]|nr:rhomboid family intramembrane serine protease [Planctomycetaceae bacterium]
MFVLIPVSTDAPVYHWPYGTVGLIIANTALFFLLPELAPYIPQLEPIHLLEWIRCLFLHPGIVQLIGNMIFLWGFGLVVEGKVGTWRFLLIYFAIGMLVGVFDRMGAGGATPIIYGLMAISLVWAPKNEMTIYFIAFVYRLFINTFEVSILVFSGYYIFFEFMFAVLFGFQFTDSLMNLLGSGLGGLIGYLMLKRKLVDCESWDLISVLRNQQGRSERNQRVSSLPQADYQLVPRKKKKQSTVSQDTESEEQKLTAKREKSLTQIRTLIEAGKVNAALTEYQGAIRLLGSLTLPAGLLKGLADGLYRQRMFTEALPYYEEYLNRFPDLALATRVRLAALYLEVEARPRAALRVLSEIPPHSLSDRQEQQRETLERRANSMIEEGVIELERRHPR